MSQDGLRKIGVLIRTCRSAASLTQAELGRRAGIVGKYVSEIERGRRDVPFSTLSAIVEQGLGLALEIRFRQRLALAPATGAELPRGVVELAQAIAELGPVQRTRVIAIVRILLRLARR
jgi:transcriptional regulator with XRE-family HTH domain